MAGMKTRFTRINNFLLTNAQVRIFGILMLLLALSIPTIISAQVNPRVPKLAQSPQPQQSIAAIPAVSATTQMGWITDVKVVPEKEKVTVTLTTDRLLTPIEARLDNPPRLVLDFLNTGKKVQYSELTVNSASVKKLRMNQSQNPDPKTRVVFDLDESFKKYEIALDRTSVRIVFLQGQPSVKATPVLGQNVRAVAQPVQPSPAPDLVKAPVNNEPQKPRSELSPIRQVHQPANSAVNSQIIAALKEQAKILPIVRTESPTHLSSALASPISVPMPAFNPNRPIAASDSKYSGQPLTLDLINTSLVDFFRLMAEEGGVNIVLDPEVKGNITIKVVKLPWDQIFDAALLNNDLDKQIEGNLIRIAKKSTLQNEAKQSESLKKANLLAADLETRIKRLNYAQAKSLIKAIEEQKTVRGTAVYDERTNSLILTDIPSSLNKLYKLIDQLDIPQPQVEIEARIVSATRDFARDIGVQFGFVQGNLNRVTVGGPNTFGTIGGTRPSTTPSSTYAAGTSTGRGASEGTASESGAVSAGGAGNYNVNLPATKAFGGLGISIGNIFDTFLLDAAITAGESKGKAKLISQPKVIAQNNSSAVIQQGIRFPVQTVSNNTVSIQFFNAALTLTVTPQITYEGNIILDLKVENNSADFGNMVNNVPSIRTSESTTRILITDGGTTIIGGILVDEESDATDKVPGLGSLPLIGNLFKRSSVMHSTQEVLFFVTPRIVK